MISCAGCYKYFTCIPRSPRYDIRVKVDRDRYYDDIENESDSD